MYQFDYVKAKSLKDAGRLLASHGEAKLLAGGMTLIPTLKQRLARPSHLVDITQLAELQGIKLKAGRLEIGAATRHHQVAASAVVRKAIPALAQLAGVIGDPQVRNRGTLGGSVANNDPAADYPAAVLGLGATIVTTQREIAADDFFQGMFSTALEANEIITKVQFPIAKKVAYQKFKHPASGFALVGVFVSKRGSDVRVAVTGAGANGVFRVPEFEAALKKRFNPKSLDGVSVSVDGMNNDIHAGPEYRAHLVGVLARRAVADANARK
jgi:carbon-monoxide dehydrogenase medium subunit